MRVLLSLVAGAVLVSNVWAGVTTNVYLADEQTPLLPADPNASSVYRDIMAGTRLTIFVSSDVGAYWLGSLQVPLEDANAGMLSARGYTEDGFFPNYAGSCLPAAGFLPLVDELFSLTAVGFDLIADFDSIPGEWFVLDYRAAKVGTCNVELHEYALDSNGAVYPPDPSLPVPMIDRLLEILSFSHVPSRDFDGDTIVNFADFALLAGRWGPLMAPDPNAIVDPNEPLPAPVDLNADGLIDRLDMALFSDFWLERTDFKEPDTEPNAPAADL